jgi:hypothetical protein
VPPVCRKLISYSTLYNWIGIVEEIKRPFLIFYLPNALITFPFNVFRNDVSSALQEIVFVAQSEGNIDCVPEPARSRDIISSFENSIVHVHRAR